MLLQWLNWKCKAVDSEQRKLEETTSRNTPWSSRRSKEEIIDGLSPGARKQGEAYFLPARKQIASKMCKDITIQRKIPDLLQLLISLSIVKNKSTQLPKPDDYVRAIVSGTDSKMLKV